MRDFAKDFYSSRAWANTREAYAKSVGYLCEECAKEGRTTPGEIVHHKIHLTPQNITNPDITLNFQNLEYVCRNCHAKVHDKNRRRYSVDEFGRVTAR